MSYNKLTSEEDRVIIHKGTEPAFTGEYDDFYQTGIYLCRRCGTPLYRSDNKFDAHCGWPSFDQEIPGAVERKIDDDGLRTEITCATCGAHLGHVFEGEKLTPTNARHCVNSLSMSFVPIDQSPKLATAVFGAGCFWSVEAILKRLAGVLSVMPGYSGGLKVNPTYEEVSTGKSGHAEVVKIEFDPKLISYVELLRVFFTIHDPTAVNRQGNDVGEQYRSIILYTSEQQKDAAERFIAKLNNEHELDYPVATEIQSLEKFYPAEDYHLDYYEHNTDQPYCRVIVGPKLKKFEKEFSRLLKK